MSAKTRQRRPAMANPAPSPATPAGEAMPLSHATGAALRDLATHHNMTPQQAAETAIQIWHWLARQQADGWTPCIADPQGEIHTIQLPKAQP